MVQIRQETPEDYDKVYEVVKTAFETAEHSDGNEQDLVVALRKSDNFIPELSLVAVKDGEVVGHIMFTKVKIGEFEEVALAPVAVAPKHQHHGIGGQLVEEGHRIAKALGYHYSVVLGSDKYYPQFGYLPAEQFGIKAPFRVASKNYMVKKLDEGAQSVSGMVEYAEAFGL